MSKRVLFTMIVLFGAATSAEARKHRRAATPLVLEDRGASTGNRGAKLDARRGAALVVPALTVVPSFVEFHSARVENDLLLFQPTLIGITLLRSLTPARAADDLEVRRDRDRLLLFRETQPQGASVGLGLAMFGATTILSAHAPRPLRMFFDRPVLHLGPAVFDGGGMGAGVAGRGL